MPVTPARLAEHVVIAIHSESISGFGGTLGVHDSNLLGSALSRPRNLLAYDSQSNVFELAAAYCFGLIKDHSFLDGNKRTGLWAAGGSLRLNGYTFTPVEADVVTIINTVASG